MAFAVSSLLCLTISKTINTQKQHNASKRVMKGLGGRRWMRAGLVLKQLILYCLSRTEESTSKVFFHGCGIFEPPGDWKEGRE